MLSAATLTYEFIIFIQNRFVNLVLHSPNRKKIPLI